MSSSSISTSFPVFDLQGHRGARGLLPENTIPAFLRALELGVTTLEMDVVISKDSQVVVSHDPWFSGLICTQPSGEPVPVAEERTFRLFEMTYEEIAQFDCGLRGNPNFPRQQPLEAVKPLLRDVIEAAEAYTRDRNLAPVFYNIETKSKPEFDGVFHPVPDIFTRLLYEVLDEQGIAPRATIQSFDGRTLQIAHALDAELSLALLVEYAPNAPALEDNLALLGFTPSIYSPEYRLVDADLIARAHARGMRVIPWTVNTYEEMAALQRLGVDGIITDYPDIGRRLLFDE